ncbi:hypothetical protein [Bdellovibrio reynosensis]|uniref:Lipoprotein n=1 Tax=Bdellovibrio reynosensis TaxID=2835041 RepID=A0ABY4C865_9BACT|nr:hypothetical protein [Bdellovibrio reynosensis]UOF01110.1 hypothetical protein MNR06_15520 [Bdellovibrio reynosensis]
MKRFVQVVLIWMPLALGACTQSPGYHVEKYHEVKFSDLPVDVKIPTKAWDLLELKAPAAAHGEGGGDHGAAAGEATPAAKNIIFGDVAVFLVQKNDGIVKSEAVKILLPKGGGTIDLAQFITDKQGSFYVGFEVPGLAEAVSKKVLFVSGAKKRKLGDKVIGAGCNQFVDITDSFLKNMQGEGLKVNTTQERYLSVLGGTFLFSAEINKDVQVAAVTFKNSKYNHLFCEEN